uniref:DDE Tnp4 domain-containing protein n=1 Tax=Brassica oleracea var. oleracea TaxID=109376 RepID=A0A0D3BUW2_BRAOL
MQLWNDYFSEDAMYPSHMFRRRFIMNKPFFMRIVDRLSAEIPYFQQRRDATGRFSHSPLQKATAAIRMMAYGCPADAVDEYLRLGETTVLLCLEHFVQGIINLFGDEYLRRPTPEDLQRLLDIGEIRGFPGMVGSIDCMHWEWKNCPTAWKGQYTRGSGKPIIVLEAVASADLWIWHAFFGPPGTLNDINVLDRSPVFDDILQGRAPKVNYIVNGYEYHLAYYLTDEDERDGYTQFDVSAFAQPESNRSSLVDFAFSTDMPSNLGNVMNMMSIRNQIRDNKIHQQLKADLVENIWQNFGTNQDYN